MRRRNLLGGTSILVTLSSYSSSVAPSSGSVTVTAYANGVAITDATNSNLSFDGTKITSCTINSSGVITVNYTRNVNQVSQGHGWMKLTYQGVTTKMFELYQAMDYETGNTSVTQSYGDYYSAVTKCTKITFCPQNGYSEVGFYCNDDKIAIMVNLTTDKYKRATMYYYKTYASGNRELISTTPTTWQTSTFCAPKHVTNYSYYYMTSIYPNSINESVNIGCPGYGSLEGDTVPLHIQVGAASSTDIGNTVTATCQNISKSCNFSRCAD